MTDIAAEHLATLTVPRTDRFAMDLHNGARASIDGMPAWRQSGAETQSAQLAPMAQIDRSNARK